MTPRVYPSVPIAGAAQGPDVRRGDIVLSGLDHGGPSFEVRIFLGNPSADADTERTPENGYAESIHVYGMGMAQVAGASHSAARPAPPRLLKTRSVIATDAIRTASAAGAEVDVTLVAVPAGDGQVDPDLGDVAVALRVGETPADVA